MYVCVYVCMYVCMCKVHSSHKYDAWVDALDNIRLGVGGAVLDASSPEPRFVTPAFEDGLQAPYACYPVRGEEDA